MRLTLDSDVRYVKGVGDVLKKKFLKLGIDTVGDLIFYYPRRYEDWSNPVAFADAPQDEPACFRATLSEPLRRQYTASGILMYRALITDGAGLCNLIFFNNKYVEKAFEEGGTYLFYGKMTPDPMGGMQLVSPAHTRDGEEGLRPVYRMTAGLGSPKILKTFRAAFEQVRDQIEETLPGDIIRKYDLYSLADAVRNIHDPADELSMRKARQRLIFEELLTLQLGLFRLRNADRADSSVRLDCAGYTGEFLSLLPYRPTGAQLRCINECAGDMSGGAPMRRLLQGDVGSGKTTVAAALIYACVKNGFQAALMAPTEILAEQHADGLSRLFGDKLNIALLTGSVPAAQKKKIKKSLLEGGTDLVVGTHAVITPDVEFSRPALFITDEQHRFGVRQRAALAEKGKMPHVLFMSATPIPRTMSMIMYGDMDVSVIDELPAGRTGVRTYWVNTSYRERVYAYIEKFLRAGRQGYVICPRVDEDENSDLVPVETRWQELEQRFPDFKVGILHGKLKPKQKDEIMRSFAKNETQLLVATTVVEVGIDVPNAAVMLIENADRFGLSQLHQLRGRIGRGKYRSDCILMTDAQNKQAVARMQTMCRTNDGFEIARADLEERGPGQFLGSQQHGLPELKIADLLTDTKALAVAQRNAREIIDADPDLSAPEHAAIRRKIDELMKLYDA